MSTRRSRNRARAAARARILLLWHVSRLHAAAGRRRCSPQRSSKPAHDQLSSKPGQVCAHSQFRILYELFSGFSIKPDEPFRIGAVLTRPFQDLLAPFGFDVTFDLEMLRAQLAKHVTATSCQTGLFAVAKCLLHISHQLSMSSTLVDLQEPHSEHVHSHSWIVQMIHLCSHQLGPCMECTGTP